ncbi:hypothetical protein K491DRAFT_723118 [Lophiostoma macrostomum CBS 122681]|uniref:Uncharacterized protein n=1 Tax=Lophiostoma macrostomum CBS 122681 TaxID=1314788 RepID=A0A6A6SIW0_9PLEO|nr:hypothetical protein K491DRAFT_723118 [Lophiostoma macrostomum CBS 122681]
MEDEKSEYLLTEDKASRLSISSVSSYSSIFEPISNTSLALFLGYTVKQPVTLIMKQIGLCHISPRHRLTISYASPSEGPGETLFEVAEEQKHEIVFRTTSGEEVMRIRKNAHNFTQNHEYAGVSPSGEVKWSANIMRKMLAATKYGFTVHPDQHTSQPLEYRDKVHGRDKGLLLDERLLAIYKDRSVWSLKRKPHVVKIAPGMDMLVALGMAFVRYDKLRDDANTAAVTAAVS